MKITVFGVTSCSTGGIYDVSEEGTASIRDIYCGDERSVFLLNVSKDLPE
jgi:hypothetical protein